MVQFVCTVNQVVTSEDMDEFKCVLTMLGEQFVITFGMNRTLVLSVECWGIHPMVSFIKSHYLTDHKYIEF